MGRVFAFSLTAALNPTLVAATTVMLLLDKPKRLMLGYLCGALMTSITLGLVIVFALKNSGSVSTTQNTLSPAVDIVLGAVAVVIGFALRSGRPQEYRERRKERKESKSTKPKEAPRWQRELSKGSPRMTFAVGALLTLPGASYLASLHAIDDLKTSTAATVLLVIAVNLVMLALLEVPLLCFQFAPDWTPNAIERAKAWIGGHGLKIGVYALWIIGTALIVKGIAGLIAAG